MLETYFSFCGCKSGVKNEEAADKEVREGVQEGCTAVRWLGYPRQVPCASSAVECRHGPIARLVFSISLIHILYRSNSLIQHFLSIHGRLILRLGELLTISITHLPRPTHSSYYEMTSGDSPHLAI